MAESASTSTGHKRKRQVSPESDVEYGSEEEDTGQVSVRRRIKLLP
jgi:hypothetical protein